ncbi:MAG: signal peptidase II [Longicatena sp.]
MKIKHGILLALVLMLDQLTKFFIDSTMKLGDSIDVISGFFRITYVQNTGAAWSMFEGKMIFFYIISVVFLIGMFYFYRCTQKDDTLTLVATVLMIAGTLGNFIDRLVFQHVRDFLDFVIFGYDFPVFNVADMALCIGIALICLSVLIENYGGFKKCEK